VSKARLSFALTALLFTFAVALIASSAAQGPKAKAAPQWIWAGKPREDQTVYLRKPFDLTRPVTSARLSATCDNRMTVYLNGKEVLSGDSWEEPVSRDVTELLRPSVGGEKVRNVLAVKAHNDDGPAGLVLRLVIESGKKEKVVIITDGDWRGSDTAPANWAELDFDDSRWAPALVVGPLGGAPWTQVTEASLGGAGAAKLKKPTATPVELIKAKKDFKVESLYSVPKETQGSWVSMCADPKGRLIASDQSGKLYRVTPPPLGGSADQTRVEELPVDLGEAQGLLWAFDSLYVVVNHAKKYPSGLWRVWSSKGDDVLDSKEMLRGIDGSGEHGPHAVLPGPDGKSLYVLCGNHTKLVKLSSTKVPPVWGEDFLVPRLWDASGHAVGILAPGGCIYRVSPDGKRWELISMGYRNEYDAAFNRDGELFTYDADMEWDMSLPWYRPTRVCHAVPGSEFGWRGGTGKMYEYHPDNLPPVVNVGPGSPTGMVFGYGAKFPTKYQEALFLCDWSYGKIYACHLKPHGSTYTGELEDFLTGSPLPLTDIVVGPKDGALYFIIGGRSTMSGLYRVSYIGKESTEPIPATSASNPLRDARHRLESYYGKKDPQAVEVAWPYLGHEDRFLRWAARTVLEFQDPATWQEKALKETDAVALTSAVIGLARVGDKALEPRMLEALERIDWSKLTAAQKIDTARAYQLTFVRMGAPSTEWKERVGKRLDAFYPDAGREVNAELCKVLCYLETPGVVAKTLALLAKAPTQEEQIEYALSLRMVKTGWTKAQHEQYFNWFHKGAAYRGGNSFHGFLRNIRADAIKSLSPAERDELKDVLAVAPTPTTPKFETKARPLVKRWTVDELVPAVEKGMTGRDFDRGRQLFGEAKCFVCHRFNNEGGGTGPDLTQVSGRFGVRDLLESIIEPSKVISDQYQAIVVTTTDGQQVVGRIVNLFGDNIQINTDMLDPNKLVGINRNKIESIEPSPVSMMPTGLVDTFNQNEILDLVAYLYSRGDRNAKMFRKE
jgi:putative heme-binding domain-containing protein